VGKLLFFGVYDCTFRLVCLEWGNVLIKSKVY